MNITLNHHPTVIRTEWGLTIAGTRITLYQIMDFLKAGYSHEEILTCFRLTIIQMTDVLKYIETHRDEVEFEYRQVVSQAEERKRYWDERNKERFDRIAKMKPRPELRSRLQAWKVQLSAQV